MAGVQIEPIEAKYALSRCTGFKFLIKPELLHVEDWSVKFSYKFHPGDAHTETRILFLYHCEKIKNTALDLTVPTGDADLRFLALQPGSAMGGWEKNSIENNVNR